MINITNSLALRVTESLLSKRGVKLNANFKHIRESIKEEYLSSLPEMIQEAFEVYPQYFKNSCVSFQDTSPINFTEKLPHVKHSHDFIYIESDIFSDDLKEELYNYRILKEEFKQKEIEICQAIIKLSTLPKLALEFPEAYEIIIGISPDELYDTTTHHPSNVEIELLRNYINT